MSRRASPFRPLTVLAMLAVGSVTFLLMLYALGAGLDGRSDRDGGAHAASNGLNGFSAIVDLLERRGHDVQLTRNAGRIEDEALLVLTPQHGSDADEVWDIMTERRYVGPTLVIAPKWFAMRVPESANIEAEPGWVILGDARRTGWLEQLEGLDDFNTAVGETTGWSGLGLSGSLPDETKVQASQNGIASGLQPLIVDSEGDMLAGYWDNGGFYPVLAQAAGLTEPPTEDEADDLESWPVVILIEPDLMNNYGLADQTRARAAVALIDVTLEDYDLPIVFDLTIAGLGRSDNLMTLAFRPPFLAATLCMILAAMVIGWRAFRRFGPPLAPHATMAMGKRQLAQNGASLIERAKRLHLLGPPYAALVSARIAQSLGIREADPQQRDAAITHALTQRGLDNLDFQGSASALRQARHPGELLRAARALRTIERTVTQ